jgi:uncharacterized protein YccT (UPF0319 family)
MIGCCPAKLGPICRPYAKKKDKVCEQYQGRKEIKSNPIIASFENYLISSMKHIPRISK